MNWYYETARKRSFLAIVFAFGIVKLFGHVWDVDFGLVQENAKQVIENAERADHKRQEQEDRDRYHKYLENEELWHRCESDRLQREKDAQGFEYYCKKD